jgi:LytS/YehU family sensor histidine kinase
MTSEQLLNIAGSAGLIMALVQIIKPWIKDTRWNPAIAVIIGIILNVLVQWATGGMVKLPMITSIVQGIIAGVTASGLYSVGNAMTPTKPPTTQP